MCWRTARSAATWWWTRRRSPRPLPAPEPSMRRAAACVALALLLAAEAHATERERRDVTVIEAGRQAASFDLPDGDAICVRAHVTEEDPAAASWHLKGHVELRVSSGGRAVFTFAANELVVQKTRGPAVAPARARGAREGHNHLAALPRPGRGDGRLGCRLTGSPFVVRRLSFRFVQSHCSSSRPSSTSSQSAPGRRRADPHSAAGQDEPGKNDEGRGYAQTLGDRGGGSRCGYRGGVRDQGWQGFHGRAGERRDGGQQGRRSGRGTARFHGRGGRPGRCRCRSRRSSSSRARWSRPTRPWCARRPLARC